jgi:hypothetical protein
MASQASQRETYRRTLSIVIESSQIEEVKPPMDWVNYKSFALIQPDFGHEDVLFEEDPGFYISINNLNSICCRFNRSNTPEVVSPALQREEYYF